MQSKPELAEWDRKNLTEPNDFYYAPDTLIHSIVRSDESGGVIAVGKRDWSGINSQDIDGDTMLAEASVGKVRWAGLAYMLQQEGIVDVTANARDFFAQPRMKEFFDMDKKYPGKNMQELILNLFKDGNSDKARLVDFTTHMAGMGDLRMHEISFYGKGITGGYTLADSLTISILKDDSSPMGYKKPFARGPMVNNQFKDDNGEYGKYQYSNVGYMLLAEAMEAAYYFHYYKKQYKNYQTLLNDFMLNPIEGRAAREGLMLFTQTKFAKDIKPEDNVCITPWKDTKTKKIVPANEFDGHLGAVGPLSSHNDSVRFFEEYFRGFPGTADHGKDSNKFFSDATIEQMHCEWKKHNLGRNPEKPTTNLPEYLRPNANTRDYYQGPAFVVEVDKESSKILSYHKTGIMFGCHKLMEFRPETGKVHMVAQATENVSAEVAKEAGVDVNSLMAAYVTKDGEYNRCEMSQSYKNNGIEAIRDKIDGSHAAKITQQKESAKKMEPGK